MKVVELIKIGLDVEYLVDSLVKDKVFIYVKFIIVFDGGVKCVRVFVKCVV